MDNSKRQVILGPQKHYLMYLIVIALGGWTLASYDVNLLVLALPWAFLASSSMAHSSLSPSAPDTRWIDLAAVAYGWHA